jgi:eukaryotic-like serine/threonine-protein kinase
MTADRFNEVERVCLEALEQAPDRRAAFLDETCRDDADLRAQVDRLLAGASNAEQFLEAPPAESVALVLKAGDRLGPYEVVARIGAGGMGEVYRARDTRLDREVALKVLGGHLAPDPLSRARFEREARTIGALNHPHICTLYDIGTQQGSTFLVMEHLVGESLQARIARGRLPLPLALSIGAEIADALAAAHRQGVVHRDLKPGNVMLTKAGVKLLDFGLAKLRRHGTEPPATDVSALTAKGTIVGTPQYMAPEQIEGTAADARTDLWALGAVLYEMVTGKPPFDGASAASLVAAILQRDPAPMSTLQPITPPALEHLVRQCLAKSPDDRPDTAHDVASHLRWLRGDLEVGANRGAASRTRRTTAVAIAAVFILIGAMAGGAAWRWLRTGPLGVEMRYPSLDVRPADRFPAELGSTCLAWTPDGKALVYVGVRGGSRQIFVRRLDAGEATAVPNTEGAAITALSPDGKAVAFWTFERDKSGAKVGAIKKVPLTGGPATTVAAGVSQPPIGIAWTDSGRLLYGHGEPPYGIRELMSDGTTRTVTRQPDMDARDTLPSPLPGGQTLLLTVRRWWAASGDEHIDALTLATGARRTILEDAADARYLPTGHLAFLRRGELFVVPFDPVRLKVTGQPTLSFRGVAQSLTTPGTVTHLTTESNRPLSTGAGQFAVSSRGTLAWVEGAAANTPERRLVTVGRTGRVDPLGFEPQSFNSAVRLSPDGSRLAVLIGGLREVGLWSYDLERGGRALIQGEDEVWWPIWSKDGRSLYYSRFTKHATSIALQAAEPGSQPRIFRAGGGKPASISPDGRLAFVLDQHIFEAGGQEGTESAARELVTPGRQDSWQSWPEFSPDGHWLAYASNDSRQYEVYVRPYPGPGPARQVSVDGGTACVWHPSGDELFFVRLEDAAGKRAMMTVKMKNGVPQSRPQPLFQFDPDELSIGGSWLRTYDVSRDGSRFYAWQTLAVPPLPPPVTHIRLMQNWVGELKQQVGR